MASNINPNDEENVSAGYRLKESNPAAHFTGMHFKNLQKQGSVNVEDFASISQNASEYQL